MNTTRPPLYFLKQFYKENGSPSMRCTWNRIAEEVENLRASIPEVEKALEAIPPRRNERAEINALKKALAGLSEQTKKRLLDCQSVIHSDVNSDTWIEDREKARVTAEEELKALQAAVERRAAVVDSEPIFKTAISEQKKIFIQHGVQIYLSLGFDSITISDPDLSRNLFIDFLSSLLREVYLPFPDRDIERARQKEIEKGFIDENSDFFYEPDFFKVLRDLFENDKKNLNKYVDWHKEYVDLTSDK